MKAFGRTLRYVWPQWPRIIIVVLCAFIVAALLSVSFLTIVPLLKIMLGNEGLHGWVDADTCTSRYGLTFQVPKTPDVADDQTFLNHLVVSSVNSDSLARAARLRPQDRIIHIRGSSPPEPNKPVTYFSLLQQLATTQEPFLILSIERNTPNDTLEAFTLTLHTPTDTVFSENLKMGRFKRAYWKMKLFIVNMAQKCLRYLPRERTTKNTMQAILYIVVAIMTITLIRCLAKFSQIYYGEKIVQTAINALRVDAYGHITQMPVAYFANARPNDSVSRLMRDTNEMSVALKVMLGKALREPCNALCIMTVAMLINWQLTLVFMCGGPFVLWLVAHFGRKMRRATRKSLMASSRMLAKLEETIAGLKIVKAYNQQYNEQNTFKQINHLLLRQYLKISKVDAATHPLLEILGMLAASAALIVGVHWVVNKHMDSFKFLTLLVLLGAAADAIRKTSDIWNKIQRADAAAERVFEIMDHPCESQEKDAAALPPMGKAIEFQDVCFTYPGNPDPTLQGINLVIEAGTNVAVVGPNGSGKTTLANLLPRFYDPDSGRILIDGQDIRKVTLASLRAQIGIVTQQLVTFNDTVARNIAYGKPQACLDEIVAAAKRAYAHEFIEPLPEQYDTIIGEHSTGFSGGQLQRIIIARAILRNPRILIFDEATSQVDADSEAKIHQAIEEMMEGRTTFIIAHRFSTVIAAHIIIVMEHGQIVAHGQHKELIQHCRLYQGLYETQLVKT